MVNIIPANKPFYPTDHCGVLRIKTDDIIPKYMALALQVEGEFERFSRSNRASTQRISNLVIQVPSVAEQQSIVDEIEDIDKKISDDQTIVIEQSEKVKYKFVEMFKNSQLIPLFNMATVEMGQSPSSETYNSNGNGMIFHQGKIAFGELYINDSGVWTTKPTKIAEPYDVLMSVRAPVGDTNITLKKCCIGRGLASIRAIEGKANPLYLLYAIRSIENEITGKTGVSFESIGKDEILSLHIPSAKIEKQNQFADFVIDCDKLKFEAQERIEKLTTARKELIDKHFR